MPDRERAIPSRLGGGALSTAGAKEARLPLLEDLHSRVANLTVQAEQFVQRSRDDVSRAVSIANGIFGPPPPEPATTTSQVSPRSFALAPVNFYDGAAYGVLNALDGLANTLEAAEAVRQAMEDQLRRIAPVA